MLHAYYITQHTFTIKKIRLGYTHIQHIRTHFLRLLLSNN